MKQAQIAQILSAEFKTADIAELNKRLRLKTAPKTKYRLSGKNLGHFGVTGLIKMITAEGLKIVGETRTTLVRFEDIEAFEKAKPRSERPVYDGPKKTAGKSAQKSSTKSGAKSEVELALEDDDEDDGDYSDLMPIETKPKKKRRPTKPVGKSGSKFIPREKK